MPSPNEATVIVFNHLGGPVAVGDGAARTVLAHDAYTTLRLDPALQRVDVASVSADGAPTRYERVGAAGSIDYVEVVPAQDVDPATDFATFRTRSASPMLLSRGSVLTSQILDWLAGGENTEAGGRVGSTARSHGGFGPMPTPAAGEARVVLFNDSGSPVRLIDGGGRAFGDVLRGERVVLRLPPGMQRIITYETTVLGVWTSNIGGRVLVVDAREGCLSFARVTTERTGSGMSAHWHLRVLAMRTDKSEAIMTRLARTSDAGARSPLGVSSVAESLAEAATTQVGRGEVEGRSVVRDDDWICEAR
jgi:hypothetical protein